MVCMPKFKAAGLVDSWICVFIAAYICATDDFYRCRMVTCRHSSWSTPPLHCMRRWQSCDPTSWP